MSVLLAEPEVPSHWLLDANVLFSEWCRTLMHILARGHSANLHWTNQIEHECYRNLVRLGRLHPVDAAEEQAGLAKHLKATLHVYADQTYLADVRAVEEKDRHVAATALALRHRFQTPVGLITWNLRDFPRRPLLKLGIVRYSPDELFTALRPNPADALSTLQDAALAMQSTLASRCRRHPTSFEQAARPLPGSVTEWIEFLGRNRQHKSARLIERGKLEVNPYRLALPAQ
ncbi:MAG TPA: hypothetical protein VFV39_12490 [Limnobacter sp.]|nr:hypothetical protein [Limnobacter sp.]